MGAKFSYPHQHKVDVVIHKMYSLVLIEVWKIELQRTTLINLFWVKVQYSNKFIVFRGKINDILEEKHMIRGTIYYGPWMFRSFVEEIL